jgi:prepilin-type N-terminal cleavage/methylation domain-containing protein
MSQPPLCPSSPQRGGFTLIELLVVVAILSILAAILFPVFTRAKAAAQATSCMSNERQLGLAVQMYLADADDLYPPGAYATATGFVIWHDLIDPYVRNKRVWLCPGSTVSETDAGGAQTSHFGYNAFYLTDLALDFSNANSSVTYGASAVSQPAETVLFSVSKSSVPGSWCGDDGKFLLPPSQPATDCWGVPDDRPAEMAGLLFLDSHAKRMKLTQFYKDQSPADRWFDRE